LQRVEGAHGTLEASEFSTFAEMPMKTPWLHALLWAAAVAAAVLLALSAPDEASIEKNRPAALGLQLF
jgi:hypothetical protein